MFIESITGLSKMILVKGGHGFLNNCRNICVNHFLNVKICQTVLFSVFFPTLCRMPKDLYACLTNCVGVFRETGSVTHKKGAGRPIVRTEEIVIRNTLRWTFSNR
jgi:hypothetical protein